jgi:hypothetical protein
LTGLALDLSTSALVFLEDPPPSRHKRRNRIDKRNAYIALVSELPEGSPRREGPLSAEDLTTYRSKQADYDIFVDKERVWTWDKDRREPVEVKLRLPDRWLLIIFLRNRNVQLSTLDLYRKLREKAPGGLKPEDEVIDERGAVQNYLATKINRFRKRIGEAFSTSLFEVPDKYPHPDSGYGCRGTASFCMILRASEEPDFEVSTLA